MNSRFALAVLAAMVTLALVGGLLYGVVLAGYIEPRVPLADVVMKRPPSLPWVAAAHLPFSLLLTLVISWRGSPSGRRGAVAGATLGFLMAASYDLSQYGTTRLWTLDLTLVDPFITMVMVGSAGAVAGMVLGRDGGSKT